MLQGTQPPTELEGVEPSEDLLSLLRRSKLDNLITYDYTHQPGVWTKKDSSFIFGLAARLLKSAVLYGTWTVARNSSHPIDFSNINAYVIGELEGRYLVASNLPLLTKKDYLAVNSTRLFN